MAAMRKQMGQSLRLSTEGIKKANEALANSFVTKSDLAAYISASRGNKKGASPKNTAGISRTTIDEFFDGSPKSAKVFKEICAALKLKWQEVADLPRQTDLKPTMLFPVSNQTLADSSYTSDIDGLVQQVRSRCCDKVRHNYSKIELFNRKQVGVDQLYVDVYVLEDLASEISVDSIPSNYNPREDRYSLGRRKDNKPRSGRDFVKTHSRVMVLGKPGSGKSTFLKHLAVACANKEFFLDYIPVLIELRDIDASEFSLLDSNEFNLLKVIHRQFDDLADVEKAKQILKNNKWLIMIDGLDEVPNQYQRSLQNHVRKFVREYDQNQFILTCRTQTTEYTISGFDYVEIAEFDWEKIEKFAENWFIAFSGKEKGLNLAQSFLDVLKTSEHKPTAELAKTPILLSLTCWVFLCNENHLPVKLKRSNLYQQGIELLLKQGIERESVSDRYRQLSPIERQELLSYIAFRKFEQEQYILFEYSDLVQYIADYLKITIEEGETVLEDIARQHELLVERSQGIWSFSHLTFQEYLAAKWFCQQSNLEDLAKHFVEKRWREICLLAAEIVDNSQKATHFFRKSKETIDFCFKTVYIQNFLEILYQKSEKCRSTYNPGVVRAFYFDISFLRILPIDEINEDGESITPAWFNLPGSDFATLLGDFKLTLLLSFNIHICFDFGFISYDPREEAFGDVCKLSEINAEDDLGLDLILVNLLIILKSFTTDYAELSSKDVYRKVLFTILEAIQILSNAAKLENELVEFCKKLAGEINNIKNSKVKFQSWFRVCGLDRVNKLWILLEKYRTIKCNWSFTENEFESSLMEYYEVNKLLVECLNINDALGEDYKEEIKKVLLLPIAEIEKRKHETAQ